jgi:hypothetical protein
MTGQEYNMILERIKSNHNEGTPKTLEAAICLIFTSCSGPTAIDQAKAIIKDFMAQKMGVATMKAKNDYTQQILGELWKNLIT